MHVCTGELPLFFFHWILTFTYIGTYIYTCIMEHGNVALHFAGAHKRMNKSYIHTWTHRYMHTQTGKYRSSFCKCSRTHILVIHTYIHTHIYANREIPLFILQVLMNAYISHTYIHTYTHTYIYANREIQLFILQVLMDTQLLPNTVSMYVYMYVNSPTLWVCMYVCMQIAQHCEYVCMYVCK